VVCAVEVTGGVKGQIAGFAYVVEVEAVQQDFRPYSSCRGRQLEHRPAVIRAAGSRDTVNVASRVHNWASGRKVRLCAAITEAVQNRFLPDGGTSREQDHREGHQGERQYDGDFFARYETLRSYDALSVLRGWGEGCLKRLKGRPESLLRTIGRDYGAGQGH
jgi:hypothetical protein